MPYGISQNQPDCSGWATVKQTEDGYETLTCHTTKQEAVDQMVAVSISEGMEPMGNVDRRQAGDLKTGDFVSWDTSGGMARGRIDRIVTDGTINVPDSDFSITGTEEDPAVLITVFREGKEGWQASETQVGHKMSTLTKIPALRSMKKSKRNEEMSMAISEAIALLLAAQQKYAEEDEEEEDEEEEPEEDAGEEMRQDVSLVAPAFMRASARRGLQLLEEGYSSVSEKGLKRQTVNDAQKMANGQALSPEKWRKISPWIARHIVDLQAVKDEPTPGLVAMLLWGGGSSRSSALRAKGYAERVVEKLDAED